MKDIIKTCNEIVQPVREALKSAAAAARAVQSVTDLERQVHELNQKVAEATDSAAALALVDPLQKLNAKLQIARIREPIDKQAAGIESQNCDQLMAKAIATLAAEVIEPLSGRVRVASDRLIYVASTDPEMGMPIDGLPREASLLWYSATRSVLETLGRCEVLEQMIPLLPGAVARVEALERAAAELKDFDDR